MPGLMGCYVKETENPVNWHQNNEIPAGNVCVSWLKTINTGRHQIVKAIIGWPQKRPPQYNPLYIDCASRGGIVQQTFMHHASTVYKCLDVRRALKLQHGQP